MEAYVKAERYPNLMKFCAAHRGSVKAYICNFESVESAKKNLQAKMRFAFSNVRGEKKRGTGTDIDLELLFAEAKVATAITVVDWKVLTTSIQQLQNAHISEQVSLQIV